MKKIGLILNPVAGVGGPAGLKGSDGAEIQRLARALGVRSAVQVRAGVVLARLAEEAGRFTLLAAPGEMGETAAQAAGLEPEIVGEIASGATTAEDTIRIARQMQAVGIDLLLFAGGDGTARNIVEAVGTGQTVLGVPSGVKIHSGVYAKNPGAAAELAWRYVRGEVTETAEAEVMDIDEEKFREGVVDARLYGYLRILQSPTLMQCCKSAGHSSAEALGEIANEIVDYMEEHEDELFVIGSGTTPRAVMELLGLPDTLLGVDVVEHGQVIARDVNEPQLYDLVQSRRTKIILTVIGGQGHILGRGNQQLSPRVLQAVGLENLMIIADPAKLAGLKNRCLVVDSGDPALDQALCGYRQIITGYGQTTMMKITT